MFPEEIIPEYKIVDVEVDMMSPDKRCGVEINNSRGDHFRIICGKYHKLNDLKDKIEEITGLPFSHNKYFMGDVQINPNDKLGKFCDQFNFTWIKLTCLSSYLVFDSVYDVKYTICCFSIKKNIEGGYVAGIKSIEEYSDLLRAKLGIGDLKFYDFFDTDGKQIDPRAPLCDVFPTNRFKFINIKEKPTPTTEAWLKKALKLLDWCKANNE